MKVNQSIVFNSKTEEIKTLEKSIFNNYVLEIMLRQNKTKITAKDYTKLNTMSYKQIIQEKINLFTKISTGIYYIKLDNENILICLIDKTIEDFKKIYEKNKKNKLQKPTNIVKINNNTINKEINSKVDINSTLNHELQHKLLNIREKLPVKIDSLEEQIETNKIISNKLRSLEVNKMLVKNYVKKAAVVGIAAVAGMNLFACKKTEAPVPKADIRIDVDADISDGNKINEKEVKTQIDNANTLNNANNVNDTTNNGEINKVGANTTNNSVNKGKNVENIENDTNNSNNSSNKTQETYTYQDPNAESIAQNYIEQNKKREEQEKLLYKNRHNISDAEIDAMPIPDYIKANGLTDERKFHNRLKRRDYLWEYMADPVNFKVDYSLPDKEFFAKYGDSKTNGNGAKNHITGTPYTFGADGFPIEHPAGGYNETIVNPYNGKTYNYIGSELQWEDAENPAERRYLTQEEALEISKSFAQSFK